MNKRQQQLFISFFEQMHESEQLINLLKIDLSQCQQFNANCLFELVSKGSNKISIQELHRYISQRMSCNQRQLYQMMQKFDHSRNGFISRQDFTKQLTPLGDNPAVDSNQYTKVSIKVQSLLNALFIEILKRFRIVEISRKQICLIQPFIAFQHIDCWKKGYIGLGELKKFYQQNDFQITQTELNFLLHALRRRCYRFVNLEVWCENLNPLQFGQYAQFINHVQKEITKEILNRSRLQQESIKRSRVDNQKYEHQLNRVQRRKQAQVQRQLNIQTTLNAQLSYRAIDQNRRLAQLSLLRQNQRIINQNLYRSVIKNQIQMEAQSRRRQLDQSQLKRQQECMLVRQRQQLIRDIQYQRMSRTRLDRENIERSIKRSRVAQLQKQLEQTRFDMQQKRNRLEAEDRYRFLQSSAKRSHLY